MPGTVIPPDQEPVPDETTVASPGEPLTELPKDPKPREKPEEEAGPAAVIQAGREEEVTVSRNIINDHPWDEGEIQHMLDRGRDSDVEQNKEDFPPGSEVVLELSEEVYNFVDSLDIDETKAELAKHGLPVDGNENQLKVTLAEHLQELEDSKENADNA